MKMWQILIGLWLGGVGILMVDVKPVLAAGLYYVDSVSGNDNNTGMSMNQAWKTLAPVHAHAFQPGDVVHFKKGSRWTEGLVIDNSGAEGSPIVFKTYGAGARPIFTGPPQVTSSALTRAVRIDADWVVLEGIMVQDAPWYGIHVNHGSDHNIIQDVEVTKAGYGVTIYGQHNLLTRSYIHDLSPFDATPNVSTDEEGGAMGVLIYNSYNEFSYNKLVKCIAPYSYVVNDALTMDGSAFELYGRPNYPIDGTYVHHNWVVESGRFIELGGGSGGIVRNTKVSYNVSQNHYAGFSLISLTGVWGIQAENFLAENNTIIETTSPLRSVIKFSGTPTDRTYILRNNIFYLQGNRDVSKSPTITHDHNLYYLGTGATLGFTIGATERLGDPLFVNVAGQDFHLKVGSPAIDVGVSLGAVVDFDDKPMFGSAPDLGAYEWSGSVSPTASPAPSTSIVQWKNLLMNWLRNVGDSNGDGKVNSLDFVRGYLVNIFDSPINRALKFDGIDDMVQISDSSSLDLNNDVTLEAWIYPTVTKSQSIVHKYNLAGGGYLMALNSANRLAGRVDNGTSTSEIIDYANPIPLNTWTHVAYTFDGIHERIYINGIMTKEEIPSISAPSANALNLRIGHYVSGYYGAPFGGIIDEVRIWNIARTAANILANKNNEIDPATANLRAYWRLNESVGTIAADATTNNNIGTLTNGPTWVAGFP